LIHHQEIGCCIIFKQVNLMMPHALQVKVKVIFYGGDRPIHVSYSLEQKGEYIV
jgi:hypothetical protein